MLKTLKNIRRRDTDKFMIPHSVQEVIPIRTVWKSGILLVGQNRYSPGSFPTSTTRWPARKIRNPCCWGTAPC